MKVVAKASYGVNVGWSEGTEAHQFLSIRRILVELSVFGAINELRLFSVSEVRIHP
jgi:hypothetical protein